MMPAKKGRRPARGKAARDWDEKRCQSLDAGLDEYFDRADVKDLIRADETWIGDEIQHYRQAIRIRPTDSNSRDIRDTLRRFRHKLETARHLNLYPLRFPLARNEEEGKRMETIVMDAFQVLAIPGMVVPLRQLVFEYSYPLHILPFQRPPIGLRVWVTDCVNGERTFKPTQVKSTNPGGWFVTLSDDINYSCNNLFTREPFVMVQSVDPASGQNHQELPHDPHSEPFDMAQSVDPVSGSTA